MHLTVYALGKGSKKKVKINQTSGLLWCGGGPLENRTAVPLKKIMVVGFVHFPLVLERLYKISPDFIEYFL